LAKACIADFPNEDIGYVELGLAIVDAQLLLTDIFFSEKKNELAKLAAQSALKIYQETENEHGILNATFKLANIESAQYNSENALKLYLVLVRKLRTH